MNTRRRASLLKAVDLLNEAKEIVDTAQEEEQDALDNMPESLEGTERYEKMENAADLLSDVSQNLDDAIEWIEEASQ